ncbi:hypothetical protein ACWDUL_16200 [Nocardia niigatensis]|uniref:hypothetical protein n=1 Tax=Nocardia niigatensis TaxID=209249 RepID=UPI00031F814B|nr:hypothetical protein [Nocardia niigatensis]
MSGLPDYGTDQEPVNYADIASAVGIPSLRVTRPSEVRPRRPRRSPSPDPCWSTS